VSPRAQLVQVGAVWRPRITSDEVERSRVAVIQGKEPEPSKIEWNPKPGFTKNRTQRETYVYTSRTEQNWDSTHFLIVFLFYLLGATSKLFSSLSTRLAHAARLGFFLQKRAI